MRSPRGRSWLVCLVAALHGLFFIWYQRPGLGHAVDRSGRLPPARARSWRPPASSRAFPDAPTFRAGSDPHAGVSGVRRGSSIGCSASASCRSPSRRPPCSSRSACWSTRSRGRCRRGPNRLAARRCATALFPPIPYFGALVMTEVWTTLLFTLVDVAGRSRAR